MRLELSTLRTTAAAASAGGLMSQWRVGAIVEAIAVRNGEDGQIWLNIGGLRVPARIASGDPTGPANGEKLQLRVLRDSPVIALESVISEESGDSTVNDGLRQFLPRQASPAPLLANLAWLVEQGDGTTSLPKQVIDIAQRLWRALPDAAELQTPEGLAAAVKRSGVFLENQLASGTPSDLQNLSRDLKALLSAFKQVLTRVGANVQHGGTSTPGPLPTLRGALTPLDRASATLANIDTPQGAVNELARQTEGTLARLNTMQLVNAESPAPNAAWLLELPIRNNGQPETLRFRFERNSREGAQGDSAWTVEAAMDLGVSGALHARVSLHGSRVGVQLRTESPALRAALQSRSDELVGVLQESGLQVDRVQCTQGLPNDQRDISSTPLLAKPLLDIRV
jgi:Flagellar hook-length control protein FliK